MKDLKTIASGLTLLISLTNCSNLEIRKNEEFDPVIYSQSYLDKIEKNYFNNLSVKLKEPEKYGIEQITEQEFYSQLKKEKIILLGDVHPSRLGHKRKQEIIKEIIGSSKDNEEYSIIMEIFYEEHEKPLEEYISGKIDKEKFFVETGFLYVKPYLEEFCILDYLDIIKDKRMGGKDVKILSGSTAMGKDLFEFLRDKARKREKPPYDIPKKFEERASITQDYSKINWYNEDIYVVNKIKKELKQGRKVIDIIGETHVEEKHLPLLIEKEIGVIPCVVSQYNNESDIVTGGIAKKFEEYDKMYIYKSSREKYYFINTPLIQEDILKYRGIFKLDE
ncbi:MAG: ChaN family lipoprotein [Nanoarchaeota archaeon]|nr:ChaN family lipoprotein [Nanoarchaeota archaeon]